MLESSRYGDVQNKQNWFTILGKVRNWMVYLNSFSEDDVFTSYAVIRVRRNLC
jgi:hypothetical protein